MSGAWARFCWRGTGRSKCYFFSAQGRCFCCVCFEPGFSNVDMAIGVIFRPGTENSAALVDMCCPGYLAGVSYPFSTSLSSAVGLGVQAWQCLSWCLGLAVVTVARHASAGLYTC